MAQEGSMSTNIFSYSLELGEEETMRWMMMAVKDHERDSRASTQPRVHQQHHELSFNSADSSFILISNSKRIFPHQFNVGAIEFLLVRAYEQAV